MISDRIVEVIHGPVVMYAATRDEGLRPARTLAVGAVVHPGRETVTFFVPESRSERILSDLRRNGRVALSVSLTTAEAYQLKGRYVSSRLADAKDRAVQEIYRAKVLAALCQVGHPQEIAKPLVFGFAYQPAVAITFRVEEIFLQTPGPEAGKKIS
jgi:hypothetical protein